MSKSKQEEALAFLDDLDAFTPDAPPTTDGSPAAAPAAGAAGGEAEVLAFIDEITQKSAEPTPRSSHLDRPASRTGTPTVRKSTERVRLGGGAPAAASLLRTSSSSSLRKDAQTVPETTSASASSGGGWGWGTVWSSASAAIQQAKSAVDEQVKYLPKNEQARKWGEGMIEYAKTAQLDKLGQDFKRVGLSTLTDILNVVAPPISEHEVIQVWLSHDMRGYEGIESLVYRALARIMEQVEGGDLIVNRGDESRPKEAVDSDTPRDLNAVDGYEAAAKLAQANLDELIKNNTKAPPANPEASSSSNLQTPTTYSHIYLRIQPFLTSFPSLPASASTEDDAGPAPTQHLQFLISLSDPSHKLTHGTVTQCVPGDWLAAGMWERYEWVEDLMAEALRVGVEVIGQEYVVRRMGWGADATKGSPAIKSEEEKNAGPAEESTVGEPGELVEKPKLGEET
ncbi:maintenance of telomere capping protein 1 [Mycena alexandri]|uniref:Maintenance of telomere capping protein 1 n=1 Tax=Mycena alexandri TaxID=1745969 RepID=A0AAD6TEP4_9AGAR|nr:maintenance of telomere capping protein 1 [Mycena alexandri]